MTSLLPESVAPELLLMETKWASLVSYGLTVEALTDFLPLDVTLDVKTVRHDTLKVAERCEAELGEEQGSFIDGCRPVSSNGTEIHAKQASLVHSDL
jgi:hypothetical protein